MTNVTKKIWGKYFEIRKSLQKRFWPSKTSNVSYNRNLWNFYANNWDKNQIHLEDESLTQKDVRMLGDEWGRKKDVDDVLKNYIFPYINDKSVVGEIGTGGGRVASAVAVKVKEFTCFDISSEMLKKVQETLKNQSNVQYVLLDKAKLPSEKLEHYDFLYSFDVFPHLDLHTHWKYFQEIHRCLKPGGRAFIHTSNLTAPDGWQRFVVQEEYSVEGHYFMCPQIIQHLAGQAGFKIVKESKIDDANFYYNRDYLIVLQKN